MKIKRNRNEKFFFFFNVYTPRDSRFRGGEFLLKYVQTVSYFTLKKGRTL